jgi:Spy/CpxP family protein refolding chaperone
MIKIKKVLFGFLGAYLFAVLSLAQAQNAPGTEGSPQKLHSGQRIQEIFSQLNLTDDQKKQLEANKQQHRAKMESARQEMKTDREALKAELMKPQLDMSRIDQFHDRIKSLQSQMEDVKLNSILAVRAILTPEQYLKFMSLMQKHKQEHEKQEKAS